MTFTHRSMNAVLSASRFCCICFTSCARWLADWMMSGTVKAPASPCRSCRDQDSPLSSTANAVRLRPVLSVNAVPWPALHCLCFYGRPSACLEGSKLQWRGDLIPQLHKRKLHDRSCQGSSSIMELLRQSFDQDMETGASEKYKRCSRNCCRLIDLTWMRARI